ncbi:hypothetical protein [Niabella ginsengisoli]|uniref:Uncharacterized protein n=1 Tax=Niabella ginsengisoli TaxID=522298 RepID=A0ABS9SR49_9BACT|nr:hypothetical protein [Niabella ginsengisoli]MCH5600868.1 hypothetical protein [Niabella ginsengisoli]
MIKTLLNTFLFLLVFVSGFAQDQSPTKNIATYFTAEKNTWFCRLKMAQPSETWSFG